MALYNKTNEIQNTVVFAQITLKNNLTYPITVGDLTVEMSRTANAMQKDFSSYSYFPMRIIVDGNQLCHNKFFNSETELTNYLNSHITGTGHTVNIIVYGVVDPTKQFTKLYGINRFLSVIKGRHKYNARMKVAPATNNWSRYQQFCIDLVSAVLGVTTTFENARRCIWLPTARKSLYDLHAATGNASITYKTKITDEYVYYDSNFVTANAGEYSQDGNALYCFLDGTDYLINASRDGNDFAAKSGINAYPVHYFDYKAIYIKPIGQDNFYTNYFPGQDDASVFVITASNKQRPKIKKINAININQSGTNTGFLICNHNFASFASNDYNNLAYSRVNKVKFFIAWKDGTISEFSPEVCPVLKVNGAAVKWLIKNF